MRKAKTGGKIEGSRFGSGLYPVTVTYAHSRYLLPAKKLIRQVSMILQKEKESGQVEIILAGDRLLRRLNRKFAGKDKNTDVLSFPLRESVDATESVKYLGEIYISIEQAKRQAKEFDTSLSKEMLRLVTHGTLHLLGYDHVKTKEARRMRKKEEKYLNAQA